MDKSREVLMTEEILKVLNGNLKYRKFELQIIEVDEEQKLYRLCADLGEIKRYTNFSNNTQNINNALMLTIDSYNNKKEADMYINKEDKIDLERVYGDLEEAVENDNKEVLEDIFILYLFKLTQKNLNLLGV